jgi:mono/diheme cytochrome c family protein
MAASLTAVRARLAIVTLLAAAASSGCDWPWRHDMTDQPSPPAFHGPRSPAAGSLPVAARAPFDRETGERVANPLPAGTPVATGRAIYAMYCVPCHGFSGSGQDGPVAKFFPRVGDLAAPDVQRHGDGWLYATITNGTDTMPSYGHELDPIERWQVVQFVRTLAK